VKAKATDAKEKARKSKEKQEKDLAIAKHLIDHLNVKNQKMYSIGAIR